MKSKIKSDIFVTLWIAFGVTVILGFFVFSMIIGGTAYNGYQENGHFFVHDHSDLVEVPKIIWKISSIWGIFFWFSFRSRQLGHLLFQIFKKR